MLPALTIARSRWLLSITVVLILITPVKSWAWIHGKVAGAPTLSSPTASTDGNDHAFIAVTTNTGSGTLFYAGSTSCGLSPTAAQVKAGTVTGTVVNGSQAVSVSGVQSANPGSLSGVTAYCFYFVQTTSGDSNIVSSSSFTTNGTLSFSTTTTPAWDANPSAAAFNAIVALVHSDLTNCLAPPTNITISQQYDWQALGGGNLAVTNPQSSDDNYNTGGGQLRNALVALPGKNSIQTALFANPPVTEPTGLGDNYYITNAQSLGIGRPRFGPQPDWTTAVDSGSAWDTSTLCNGAGFCFRGTLTHEDTEGMGRTSGLDHGGIAGLLEFSSWSGTGVRNVTTTGNRFPSSDGGTTNLISACQYNQGGGDKGDWSGCTDWFTASNSGAKPPISVQDIISLTVEGWPLTHSCRITAGL